MEKNKEQQYCQCLLRKRSGNISILDVNWIPVKYGIVGKYLKFWRDDIKNDYDCDSVKGGWDDGWIVLKIYGVRSEEDIIKMDWDYRKFNWIGE